MNKIYLSISTNKVQHNNFILINSTLNISLLLWIQYIHRLINFTHEKRKKRYPILIKIIKIWTRSRQTSRA